MAFDPLQLPPRWVQCPKFGEVIADLFIPFKVPLGSKFDGRISPENRFHPSSLIAVFGDKLGMVIDLTKTDRYYDKEEFISRKVEYMKIDCSGHGEVPNPKKVQLFFQVVKLFIETNPGKYIGVHCTHGYNRTGYMICSYLVEEIGYQPETATEDFAKKRAPGIYKPHYIEEFFEKYQGNKEYMTIPPYPDWDNEDEKEDETPGQKRKREDEEAAPSKKQNTANAGGSSTAFDQDEYSTFPTHLISIPGLDRRIAYAVPPPKLYDLRRKMQGMCNWRGKADEFPGSQPVSLSRANIELLSKEPYLVSWKADGTRFLLLLQADGCYFADRDFRIFEIPNLVFIQKGTNKTLDETLIDGELVIDKTPDGVRPRFLMYDLVYFNGKAMGNNYSERLGALENEIYKPREEAKSKGKLDFSQEPFGIRPKKFWNLPEVRQVLKMMPSLPHENDGLILAPVLQPYIPGRDPKLLKWKPPHLNSVDFELQIDSQVREGCPRETIALLKVQGEKGTRVPFGRLAMEKSEIRAFREKDGKIIECTFQGGLWKFMRVRDDKSFPNSSLTAQNVIDSIHDGITEDQLLHTIFPPKQK